MNKVFVAVHALIRKGDRYLVTLRSPVNDFRPGYWDLPGGTIEFGEDIFDGLLREVDEEAGIKVKIEKVIHVYSSLQPGRHQYQIIYLCIYQSGQVRLNPNEHSKFQWALFSEIKKLKTIEFLKSLTRTYEKS